MDGNAHDACRMAIISTASMLPNVVRSLEARSALLRMTSRIYHFAIITISARTFLSSITNLPTLIGSLNRLGPALPGLK